MRKIILTAMIFIFALPSFGEKPTVISPDLRKAVLDTIKVDGSEIAVITMKKGGDIYIKFFPEDAPNTVKNFIMLANLGFYEDLTFHRVIKDPPFVVQGGDPRGDGTGGPGYTIDAEFNDRPHKEGTVAMARAQDPNSAGSQFYICLAPQPHLDGKYTVFGEVIDGMGVVKQIKSGDRIKNIRIVREEKGTPSSELDVSVSGGKHKFLSKPKYPAKLDVSKIHFFEASGNRALDGFETGKLKFTIENQGKGEAVNVNVKLIRLLAGDKLSFNREIDIGTIAPNSSKPVEIPITAPFDVPSENVKFRVEILEEFGNDADPFTFSFETKEYEPPKLVIADVGIDDDKEGDSQGDNDGIIEPGEAVEVTVGVQNTGVGDAEDVKAEMIIGNQDVNYFGKEQYNLGDITSGEYKTLNFYFWIPKRYAEDKVPISVKLTEAKGRYGSKESLNLPVGKPSGYMKEITITKKEPQKPDVGATSQLRLSIDVDNIPTNSLTRLEDGVCVVIGIEDYKYAPSATFANRDATIFYEYAKSVFGLTESNIYIRTNEDATKGEFDKIFGENGWLKRHIYKNKSDVIVYFSGHGAPDIKTGKQFLVPYDIDPNYATTAYSLEDIYKSLSNLDVKSVTLFLDACFSGVSRKNKALLAYAKPFTPLKVIENPLEYGNITVFMASEGNQISSALEDKKHGLFTYYLLKSL